MGLDSFSQQNVHIGLTSIIESSISSASLPITLNNIHAEIQSDNQVTISAHADSPLPGANQLTATGQIRVQSGLLAMHITSAQIGGLPMPGAITCVTTTEHHLQMRISKQG